ncbi:cupin domain-containing protein [Corallococcus exercitus]|uniref:cupin domain-containing protein n=1 Tax=Corallococcus exercitus TaxID=2316736 RepID=UPI001ABFA428|nr:cupin domain-containing protein [Corallococcus exercitus]
MKDSAKPDTPRWMTGAIAGAALSLASVDAHADAPAKALVPTRLTFKDDGKVPNSRFPVLVYRAAVSREGDVAATFEQRFEANGWPPQWRSSVYDFHHYHSTAHEVLGVAKGSAKLMLGGEAGQVVSVQAGDVVVLPAGTGHKRVESSGDFLVVGAYPEGHGQWDLQRPDAATHDDSVKRIAQVPVPPSDPVSGRDGALVRDWK